MPRKVPRFHSLKKIKVRQDWSKWTLYNLSRLRQPDLSNRTYFQQKWTAKSDSRAYHGEHIREKKWKRQFRRFLPAVVPMDHRYLAKHDGAEQAAGRGSGVDTPDPKRTPPMTPYMQMTYWPMERRLDTAVFRALFASSVRQARQFCVHGLVKVNGKKMIYPGYQLNPGDMFQVDPESVLFATGAPKTRTSRSRHSARAKAEERGKAREAALSAPTPSPSPAPPAAPLEPPPPHKVYQSIRGLMKDVKQALTEDVRAKDKQKLREFGRNVRRTLGMWRNVSPAAVADLDAQFEFLKTQLSSYKDKSYTVAPAANPTQPQTFSGPQLSEKEEQQLAKAFERLKTDAEYVQEHGKHDPEKPYATPWRPRNYMSAFAFIPRYLEVNQNICAAVYLRHPVARPGLAEVPTPFPVETGQLAFNWYLRRR